MEVTDLINKKDPARQQRLDKAILGIAQAYGPYKFWLENIIPIANPDATWRALMVVSALKDVGFVEQAKFLLNSPDSRVRGWACYYLGEVNHIQASEKLFALSNDPSHRVRFHARKAFISMHGGENVFSAGRQFMHDQFPVLISEDSPKGRENLAKILQKQGFTTYTADTSMETIECALKCKPQVIVTDNQKITFVADPKSGRQPRYVDNLSGLNMTWDICRIRELRETLLFMLTADELEPIFLWYGGDVFLSKSRFGAEMLGGIIQAFMQ
jgi:CheY-like chemotaxis protein